MHQNFHSDFSIIFQAVSTVKRDKKEVELKEKTSALQLKRSNLQSKAQEFKISTDKRVADEDDVQIQISGSDNHAGGQVKMKL